MKRLLSLLLTVAVIVGLIPAAFTNTAQAAQAGSYFIFPNEQYQIDSARTVTTDRVTVSGSLNNVNGSSISYSVFQVLKDPTTGNEQIINSNQGQTANIKINGSAITVSSIQLYPGLNKVTFKGLQGAMQVQDSIYFDYHNGPMMYDLKASLGGTTVDLQEGQTTVLKAAQASPYYKKANADVSISGYAPSADQVTVQVNGKSWTYNVSSYNNYKFFASPINVNKGKNIVTIKASNGTQVVETTRELTFYNGEVTFYDVALTDTTVTKTSPDLATYPDFSVNSSDTVVLNGKAIVPLPVGYTAPATITNFVDYDFSGSSPETGSVDATVDNSATATSDGYMEISFNSGFNLSTKNMNQATNMKLAVPDPSDTLSAYPATTMRVSQPFGVTLRDSSTPYIYDVNYLQGYSKNMSAAQVRNLTGAPLQNAYIFSLPAAVEVLVANSDGTGTDSAVISAIKDKNGTPFGSSGQITNIDTTPHQIIQKTINGVVTNLERIIISIDQLPAQGSQTIDFSVQVGGTTKDTKSVPVTMLYGPYVKYTKAYDGQQIIKDNQANVLAAVDDFGGQLLNIPDPTSIVYAGANRTVFLYINNVLVDLAPDASVTPTDQTMFKLADVANETKAYNALFPGENTVKFVYKTSSSSYENVIKFNYIPKNVPVIPAVDTDSIYPFTYKNDTDTIPASQIDPNFDKNGSVYSTKEKTMNVYGTFDFIDDLTGGSTAIQSYVDNLDQSAIAGGLDQRQDYILKITTPNATGGADVVAQWTLANKFNLTDATASTINPAASSVPGLDVYYDVSTNYFKFILRNQAIPTDGTPKVYSLSVYNAGEDGPSATYRLEVRKITTPFSVIRPLAEKRIVNQNFVEVVISTETDAQVTIGKQAAQKISYDIDDDGIVDYDPAYRAIVTNLKPNKDNKIDIQVTSGNTTQKDSITVKYVPTNIPGQEFMEMMKNSHKVFDSTLNLSFPKGTSLIRRDYDVASNLKNQVYTNHNILFAIANGEDGVVDRHDFEVIPANYDNEVAAGVQMFIGEFPNRFIKSSPVFWIDAGSADNITTPEYDPVTYGSDPYYFNSLSQPSFYNRNSQNELIPSKRGKLTLNYDPSVTQDAGRLVTVFHFDPQLQKWENLGGVVDEKKHTITVPFDHFGYYVVAKVSNSYQDIVDHPYGRDFIETVFAKGVMNPADQSSSFGVDLFLTRGEFVRMIVRALDLPLNYDGNRHFSDVPTQIDDITDYRYIETAARAGIVRGVQPMAFGDGPISRQDAAVIIAKALNLKLETNRTKITSDLSKYFQDYNKIEYYAQPAVLAIAKKGFIAGSPVDPNNPKTKYMFNPTATMLRGDAAIIIEKVMTDLKKLPKL